MTARLVVWDADFLCVIFALSVMFLVLPIASSVEAGATRRRFHMLSSSREDDKSVGRLLFTSFEVREVVDLLPIPFSRALNFRFVAFMMGKGSVAKL